MDRETRENYEMQEALQQQQLDQQQAAYAPQLHQQVQESQAVLVEQTNPSKIVRRIILRLQGKEEMSNGSVVDVARPKMNKEGVDNIWFILDSHINQNIILSHLDKREIQSIMDSLQEDIVDDLSLNWKKYGIEKKTDLDAINDSILVNIFMALKRAEGQNEKNWLGKISVENISGGPRGISNKKESFWSKFRV